MKSGDTRLRRIVMAFRYSRDGFIAAFKHEASFRQDILFCFVFGIIAAFLPVSAVAKAVLYFSLFFIILMELINTAIETIINRISFDRNTLSKNAKDIGSLLVLISFVNMIVVWSIIVYPLIF